MSPLSLSWSITSHAPSCGEYQKWQFLYNSNPINFIYLFQLLINILEIQQLMLKSPCQILIIMTYNCLWISVLSVYVTYSYINLMYDQNRRSFTDYSSVIFSVMSRLNGKQQGPIDVLLWHNVDMPSAADTQPCRSIKKPFNP